MIFLDLNMLGADGVQLLKNIAACKFQGYVVIVSGVSTKIIQSVEDLANKYNLNFFGSIHKPIDLKDFDDIEVFYQPQVKLRNRKLVCVEALCRLRHPSLASYPLIHLLINLKKQI